MVVAMEAEEETALKADTLLQAQTFMEEELEELEEMVNNVLDSKV
jgi:hypothetical protein